MTDDPRHLGSRIEKRHREWSKCSECRRKKIGALMFWRQCHPNVRDWAGKQQRCKYCQDRNLACGPNYRKKEDPEVIDKDRGLQSLDSPFSEHSTPLESSTPTSLDAGHFRERVHNRIRYNQGQQKPPERRVGEAGNGQSRSFDQLEGSLVEKTSSKLERLNLLGTALNFASGYKPYPCPHPLESQDPPTTINAIREKLHGLFIGIMTQGLQMADQDQPYQARWVLVELLLALEKYPGLCDNRKKGALLKIASYFQSLNDQCQYEYVLEKVANMSDLTPASDPKHDPCILLAKSYPETSSRMERVLGDLWRKTFGVDDLPQNLAVPPLQRMLWFPNIAVAWALWPHSNSSQLRPDLFGQEALHIAAARGMTEVVKALIPTNMEARDSNKRTPLFLAASNGHAPCCLILLQSGAWVGNRDDHGHTVAEVAAKGGHFDVVQALLAFKADLNPHLLWCCSSPIQAATESENLRVDLIQCLLNRGADVTVQRPCDLQSALDVAQAKGLASVAQMMRQRTSAEADGFYDHETLAEVDGFYDHDYENFRAHLEQEVT